MAAYYLLLIGLLTVCEGGLLQAHQRKAASAPRLLLQSQEDNLPANVPEVQLGPAIIAAQSRAAVQEEELNDDGDLTVDNPDEDDMPPSRGIVKRCKTTQSPSRRRRAREELIGAIARLQSAGVAVAALETPAIVQTHFHIITQSLNRGIVTRSQADNQINVLNAAYAAAGIQFTLASFTTYSRSKSVYQATRKSPTDFATRSSLRRGSAADLNIFTWAPSDGLLGWATFPNDYAANPAIDGVVVRFNTLPGGSYRLYNEGDTVVHEVGHWLGLYHTFEGGCRDGTDAGDQVADTPAERIPAYDCPAEGRDTCPDSPGADPLNNFMDYVTDPCMTSFTAGQAEKVVAAWLAWRDGK